MSEDIERRRLRWRCRRGMKELDQLLERWLEREYTLASEPERAVFRRLLDCEDDKLWKWFLGQEAPIDAELALFVQHVRGLPV